MDSFLDALIAFPTVLYTGMLGACLLYWAFVIVGAADLDLLDAAAGKVEGAAEGVADAVTSSSTAGLFALLRLDRAPVTVSVSFFALFGWLASMVLCLALPAAWFSSPAAWLIESAALAASGGISLALTSVAVRPLAPIFEESTRRGGSSLVGRTCVVRSGEVNARSGRAEIEDGGAGLVIDVRASGERTLVKGDEALIIDYVPADDSYLVEPMVSLLPDRRDPAVPKPVPLRDTHAQARTDAPHKKADP